MRIKKHIVLTITILLLTACASYKPQYKVEKKTSSFPINKKIKHSLYLIGDAGNSALEFKSKSLQLFESELKKASKYSTVLFLGDNAYPKGLPKKNAKSRDYAIYQLKTQIETLTNFKGNPIFIPGNHDWYSGLKGLKRQENYIEDKLGKNSFLPKNGCPIHKVKIDDSTVLIVIDSQWYLTNWNKHPTINDDCAIKTREQFFDEFESLIKKARGKTTLVAMHHPMYTNGHHGGQYAAKQHLSPFPVLGSLKNIIRNTSGLSNADLNNKHYSSFKKRIVTLAQENDKVIFLSGHEHSLQYIAQDNLTQIISGSGSKKSETRLANGQFSFGEYGYARLDIFEDESSYVRFYAAPNNTIVFETEVYPAINKNKEVTYKPISSNSVSTSIYTKKETTKTKLYQWLWGDRYRKEYSKKVTAPTVNLDTLYGGLTPVRKGGGNQSKSLRLKDSLGKEYTMRALRKNALRFIQAVAFKETYIKDEFDNTITENFLLDVFAGSQPYAPFVIGELAEAINIYHSNPKLYYIPKQKALEGFTADFGDELYMIEERVASSQKELTSFGAPKKIISTTDLLQKLRKNSTHELDEATYIRARLFDMLIGDWDRHEDQWRWAVFEEGEKKIYKPIPRDRDQAFSIMNDGAVLNTVTKIIPVAKVLKKYDSDLKNPKWFNLSPYPLDVALINRSGKKVWDAQVKQISEQLTNDIINSAFEKFPSEMDPKTIAKIKAQLIGRKGNLQKIADAYFKHVNRYVLIKGTDKEDYVTIERLSDGKTAITVKQSSKETVSLKRTYSRDENKEIWIYGLDGKDTFEVLGQGKKLIPIRIIGGQNNDTYKITNPRKITVYDYKSKKNTLNEGKFKKKLTDDYTVNIYDYKKLKNSSNQLAPAIGFNPDDGIKLGITNTTTLYGFERNPFSSIHTFKAAYYFATNGFEITHNSEFANAFKNLNFGIDFRLTSPNYSINFFGFGNNKENPNFIDEDQFDLDFNRVKISEFKVAPSLSWKSNLGATFKTSIGYESVEVERSPNRFISTLGNNINSRKNFLGLEAEYNFINKDQKAFPTLGIEAQLIAGYKTNLSTSKGFTYIKPALSFDHKINSNGKIVVASKVGSHINFGNSFEFFQAATIGGDNGLRGFRNQRFTGKRSLYQTTDLRVVVAHLKTNLVPINLGFYGGFDYGKVWLSNNNSKKWNNSYGGGLFINAAEILVGNASLFSADEGLRFAFKLGFGF